MPENEIYQTVKKKYNDLLNLKFEKYKYEIEYEKIKKKNEYIENCFA